MESEIKRYYAKREELAILNCNISEYFSFPERSPERNALATEISLKLQAYSTHWTKRAVRLWFNNNKSLAPKDAESSHESPKKTDNELKVQKKVSNVQFQPTFKIMPVSQDGKPMEARTFQDKNVDKARNLWNPSTGQVPPTNVIYAEQLKKIFELSRGVASEKFHDLIVSFDDVCNKMAAQNVHIPLPKSTKFKSSNFPMTSQEDLDFIPSVGIQTNDVRDTLWQQRAYQEKSITRFDSCYNGPDFSLYVHCVQTSTKRAISFTKGGKWTTLPLETQSRIEACIGDENHCFLMTSSGIITTDNNSFVSSPEINIARSMNTIASICLADNGSAIGALGSLPYLFLVKGDGNICKISVDIENSWGVSSINCMNNRASEGIIVSYSQSPTARMINFGGRVVRCFLGHTEPINYISSRGNNILTISDDKTAKLWDIRDSSPTMSLSSDNCTFHGGSLSDRFAVLSTDYRALSCFDIRSSLPLLGVMTDEYIIESPYYFEEHDHLTCFGVASKDGISDSILFLNDNMISTKYVLRSYRPFVSSLIL